MAEPVERLQRALSGRYRIEHELGAGAMATVYMAEDVKHGRRVAVKLMSGSATSSVALQRFSREIQIVAQLQHPHIVPLFDSGDIDGAPYYVMPVARGESLRARLRRERQLPVSTALRIARDVAAALAFAHDRGVVHRDIKPENILLEGDHALVADFGVAHGAVALGDEKLTETGTAVGTPMYMSPEQAAGESDVDGRSDIYSLACVLYEMLVGEPPFSGVTTQALLARKLTAPIPDVGTVRDGVSASLERVIKKALARSPADRYQTAGELAAALDQVALSPSEPVAAGGRRFSRAARSGVIAVVVVAGTAAAAWEVRNRFLTSPDGTRSIALLPFENVSRDTSLDYRVEGMHQLLVDELSRITSLRVPPRTSVLPYRSTTTPMSSIADKLKVDVLGTGSVRLNGDTVNVVIRLIQPRPERQLVALTFDAALRDSRDLEKAMTVAIVRQLRIGLSAEDRARLALSRPIVPAAREAYLKGTYHVASFTPQGLAKGIAYFEDAIRLDSTDPGPRIALAEALIVYGIGHGNTLDRDSSLARAKTALRAALELDSGRADAHAALGEIFFWRDWDWAGSEREFKQAILLNPQSAQAHWGYSTLLVALKRFDEAIGENTRAKELDPLSKIIGADLAGRYWAAGRLGEAVRRSLEVIDLDPSFPPAYYILSLAYRAQGAHEQAIRAQEQAASLNPAFKQFLPITYAAAGRRQAALDAIASMDSLTKRTAAQSVATAYAILGERDAALHWLEVAYAAHDPFLYWIRIEPALRVLDSDPRFDALLRKLALPRS